MNKQVRHFFLKKPGESVVSAPIDAPFLSVQSKKGVIVLFMLFGPMELCVNRKIYLAHHGTDIEPGDRIKFIGTCEEPGTDQFLHLFEVLDRG